MSSHKRIINRKKFGWFDIIFYNFLWNHVEKVLLGFKLWQRAFSLEWISISSSPLFSHVNLKKFSVSLGSLPSHSFAIYANCQKGWRRTHTFFFRLKNTQLFCPWKKIAIKVPHFLPGPFDFEKLTKSCYHHCPKISHVIPFAKGGDSSSHSVLFQRQDIKNL